MGTFKKEITLSVYVLENTERQDMLDKTGHVEAHPSTQYATKLSFTRKERSTLSNMSLSLAFVRAKDELVS